METGTSCIPNACIEYWSTFTFTFITYAAGTVLLQMFTLTLFRLSAQCVGLLVDWLELLCPEIVGSPTTSVESQLDLLFGRRSPDVGQVATQRSLHNGSYLLALLAHQSSWTNIRATLILLLESRSCIDKYVTINCRYSVIAFVANTLCPFITKILIIKIIIIMSNFVNGRF